MLHQYVTDELPTVERLPAAKKPDEIREFKPQEAAKRETQAIPFRERVCEQQRNEEGR